MHFSLKNKSKSVFDNHWVIPVLFILYVIFFVAIYLYEGIITALILSLFIACGIIAILIKGYRKRAFQEFDATDQAIVCKNKTYLWSDIKNYHWWGEKQSERIGMIRAVPIVNYDPINPYKYSKDQILCLHMGFCKNINLQIDSDQVDNLSSIIKKHDIKHISTLQKVVGW
jgi:hypothetical protein